MARTKSSIRNKRNPDEAIVISQVVDVITPGDDGEHGMVPTAMLAAGRHLEMIVEAEAATLTWEYDGCMYEVTRTRKPSIEEQVEWDAQDRYGSASS